MNLAMRKDMSIAEFLAWEERQDLRYEFDGVPVIAMTGGTASHSAIQCNLAISIGGRLRGKPCQFYNTDLKVQVAGRIRYPDGFVVCSPVPPRSKVIEDPVVIFEVLNDSTERIDLVKKNQEYATVPSVKRYIVLSQDDISGTMFERIADDWVGHLLSSDTVLNMPEIGIKLPLAELYEGVRLSVEDSSVKDSSGAGPGSETLPE